MNSTNDRVRAPRYVGSAILQEALERGHEVTAIVRHPEKLQPLAKLHLKRAMCITLTM